VCKQLKLKAYKLQLLQKMQGNDLPQHYNFAADILSGIDNDGVYLKEDMLQ
jgi:hypothetical protein